MLDPFPAKLQPTVLTAWLKQTLVGSVILPELQARPPVEKAPVLPLPTIESPRNCTLLKKLKNSMRNCMLTRSVTLKFFSMEKSVLAIPGPAQAPTCSLPNVSNWKLSMVKAPGFHHW